MFAARSSWHSYPYPLRGRKAEGQSTQTPEAADLSAFFLLFQSSVGVPTESGRNSERFFRNQPYLTNQTQPTVPNQPDSTTPTMRRSAFGRCIVAPARRDVLIEHVATHKPPRGEPSPGAAFFFCTDKGPRKGSRRPRSRKKGELSQLCFTYLRARSKSEAARYNRRPRLRSRRPTQKRAVRIQTAQRRPPAVSW